MSKKLLLLVVGGIVTLVVILAAALNALPAPDQTREATPIVKALRTSTPTATWTPFQTPRPLPVATVISTVDPFSLDSDGDFLPDGVEKALGTDPFTHQCADSFRLDASVLVIVDGTLWGDDKGDAAATFPITAALRSMISVLPNSVRIGVVSAGTAATGCSSGIVLPVQAASQSVLRQRTEGIQPSAQRSLAQALRDAPLAFAGIETGTRYAVLVSRGTDTCGGDPCAEARTLKSGPLALTIDAIALTLDGPTRESLRCIADYTGGLYYQADRPEDFSRLWRTENERLSHWITGASNLQENRMTCMRCMSEIMDKFLKWARDSGFAASQPKQFQNILDQLTRNLQC
ncbi:MAG: hypothetical protein FJ011_07935 [Chloroflexi bacterium]|nr:hypothetical protein [Chloroflexota bacterium]